MAKTELAENPVRIAKLRVFDSNGIQRVHYMQGEQLELATTLESQNGYGGTVIILTEVRDKMDITVMLDTHATVFLEGVQKVSSPWVADVYGEYSVRSMVLQSLDHPVIVSPLVTRTIEVDKIRNQEHYKQRGGYIYWRGGRKS